MHGLIFTELQKYVTHKHGYSTWKTLLENTSLGSQMYMPTQSYPDSEMLSIVNAAAKATDIETAELLEDFGKFLIPDLLKIFSSSVKPEWKTLDMLEHVENTIHRAVRAREPKATPPQLICKRISPSKVEITYTSSRKICPLAMGLIKGIADHYKEKIKISEPKCMLKGDSECRIIIEQ